MAGRHLQPWVSAAVALLDRGYGKPQQPLVGDDTAPPIEIELTAADRRATEARLVQEAFAEVVTSTVI